MPPSAQVAYDEGLRALKGQEEQQRALQTRSVTLFSAATFTVGFLAPQAVKEGALLGMAGAGCLAYGVSGAVVAALNWPTDGWQFVSDASKLADKSAESQDDDDFMRTMAKRFEKRYQNNRPKLKTLYRLLTVACVGFLLEVCIFTYLIARGAST